jgi:hypothetical protein
MYTTASGGSSAPHSSEIIFDLFITYSYINYSPDDFQCITKKQDDVMMFFSFSSQSPFSSSPLLSPLQTRSVSWWLENRAG